MPISSWSKSLLASSAGAAMLAASLILFTGEASQAEPPPRVETLTGPRTVDRSIAKVVMKFAETQHVAGKTIDDSISQRAFKQFIEALDPLKLYFYQSDIDEFKTFENQLDDMGKNGDLSFAYKVYKRFLQRVDERIALADEFIDSEFDYSVDEQMVSDRDATKFASTPEEARERWRRQIKFSMLVLKGDLVEAEKNANKPKDPNRLDVSAVRPGEDPRERLHRRYASLKKRWHEMDADELLELFVTSITSSLDPHSTYMSPNNLKNFNILMSLNLEGIGAQLSSMDGLTTISSIVPGGAASRDGRLKVGDHIVSVGQGSDGEMIDVIDLKLDLVVDKIRGPAGTTVLLGVQPAGGGETKVIDIKRAKIELEDAAARGEIVEQGMKPTGTPYKFGYIDLPSFYQDMQGARENSENYRSTTRDVRLILADFRTKGVDAVVLDLRRNGGGSLTEAINLTGLFIDRGPVVQVKNPDGSVEPYMDENAGVSWDGPLVVMTTKMSASASEIFAGTIKDYRRGIIVGDPQTHGKGTVQTLVDLGRQLFRSSSGPEWGALKLTIQQFYLPGGESTQKSGVAADVILPSLTSHMDIAEGDLDYALDNDRVKAIPHEDYAMVNGTLLTKLRDESAKRIQESEDFDKLLRRIEIYRKQKEEKFVSLKEEDFFNRRKELDADKVEEDTILDSQINKDKVFTSDYYTREVLSISKDYVEAVSALNLAKAG